MGTNQPQQFCVRWNSYHSNLQNAFPKLLTNEHFVDVTLACENALIKCHKVVLSACSAFFENILIQNPCPHPTIILKDMKFVELQALVDFMYKGEVNVTQEDLPSLLKAADSLQIRGLSGSEHCLNQQNISAQMQAQTTPVLTDKAISIKSDNQDVKKRKIDPLPETTTSTITPTNTNDTNNVKDEDNSQDSEEEDDPNIKNEQEEEISYNDDDFDMDYLEADDDTSDMNIPGTSEGPTPDYPIANVSCQYDNSLSNNSTKRIRRSEAELRQAADCITRGQTFQNVSDQFNIPISTIRFFMARKGILPRRKRGRSSGSVMGGFHNSNTGNAGDRSGNSSPIGPPFHIVHYKLPELGPKLK